MPENATPERAKPKNWVSNNVIALVAGLYLFVALSGLSMYLHHYPFAIWWSHQWVGVALAIASALLAWRHWEAVRGVAGRVVLFGALALVLGIGFRLAVPRAPAPEPKDSTHQILSALTHTPITGIAPVFRSDPEKIVARLAEVGFVVVSSQQSISEVARANGRTEREALGALTELLWKK
jgi:hypothetical protein